MREQVTDKFIVNTVINNQQCNKKQVKYNKTPKLIKKLC